MSLSSEVAQLSAQLKDKSAHYNADKVDELTAELEKANDKIKLLQEKLAASEYHSSMQQQSLAIHQKRTEEHLGEKIELQSQIRSLEQTLESTKRQLLALDKKNDMQMIQLKSLSSKMLDAQYERDETERQLKETKQELAMAKEKLAETAQVVTAQQQTLESHAKQRTELEGQFDQLLRKNADLVQAASSDEITHHSLINKVENLVKENDNLQQTNKAQQQQIETLQTTNNNLKAQFYRFVNKFLEFLHNKKAIKITNPGAYDAKEGNVLIQSFVEYRKEEKQKTSSVQTPGPKVSSSSSTLDYVKSGLGLWNSSKPSSEQKSSDSKTGAPSPSPTK